VETSVIEVVAKYFYFTGFDKDTSFTSCLKVLSELKANQWIEPKYRGRWIEILSKWKPKEKNLNARLRSQGLGADMKIPKGFNPEVWFNFATSSEPSEVEAILLSKMLEFTDEEIAEGLAVTVGTVRYRVGRGLRHLGGYLDV
jgi:hypothetical protein